MLVSLGMEACLGGARSWKRAESLLEQDERWRMGEGGGTGSKTPAPGQTISAPPNSFVATWNMRSRWCHSRTSVCWKTARAED